MSYIVIDDNLRTMTIPQDIKILGVESDDDVNKIAFKMPKTYNGYDLSTFEARINYLNANNEGDLYIAQDLETEGENLTFTWIVGRNACAYKGNVKFIVCLKKFNPDESGVVIQEFNTTVYQLPVLQGLETVEAVVQDNPDIIEQILQKIDDSGMFDPTQYYTKTEVDDLIPTELPNPEKLTINGTEYDGSTPVSVNVEATTIMETTVTGKFINVKDAVPEEVKDLDLFDGNGDPVSSASVVVTNKNLFRLDLISAQTTSKNITFTKNEDGSITANGTSSGDDALVSCSIDKNAFLIAKTYTLFSGKTVGNVYVRLSFVFSDSSTVVYESKNEAITFVIAKTVSSCTASIVVKDNGTTINNEIVYPQLECSSWASSFTINEYSEITFTGSNYPTLPDIISNLWSNDDSVANISMTYDADSTYAKINNFVDENMKSSAVNGQLVAISDGLGNITIGLG